MKLTQNYVQPNVITWRVAISGAITFKQPYKNNNVEVNKSAETEISS